MTLPVDPTGGICLDGSLANHPTNRLKPVEVAARFTDEGGTRDKAKHIPLFPASSHNAAIDGAITILKRNHRAEA
jgi:glucokinase